MKKPMLHFRSVKLLDNFRQVVNPTSNKPASTNIIQDNDKFKIQLFEKLTIVMAASLVGKQ